VRGQNRISFFFFGMLAAAALAASLPANFASAQDVTGAANAFSRAQKAELSGDHATAAELFELADSLVPSPEALRSALRSRRNAGQLGTAALHAEALMARYPDDERSQELVNATLELAAKRLMRFEIDCQPSVCAILIDGTAATVEANNHHVLYVEAGKHQVIAVFDDVRSEPQFAEGEPGMRGSLAFSKPPAPAAVTKTVPSPYGAETGVNKSSADSGTANHEGGLPRWAFLAGVAVTVGLGVATVWSGLDVLRLHEKYKKDKTKAGFDEGRDRELRTNILIGATAAAGVTTAVLAIFTRWKDSGSGNVQGKVQASVGVVRDGGLLSVSGNF
jgi:hypothetical protein